MQYNSFQQFHLAPRPPKPVQPPPPPPVPNSQQTSPPTSASIVPQPALPYQQYQQFQYSYPYPSYSPPVLPNLPLANYPFYNYLVPPIIPNPPLQQPIQPHLPIVSQFAVNHSTVNANRPNKKKNDRAPQSANITVNLNENEKEEGEYYCEPCDKSFKKQFDYSAHCKTHEKCSHPDCPFVGSKKVVMAHYHSKHGIYAGNGYKLVDVEGQKFNLLLGYSPEEIENWKKERRQRFPTKTKIEEEQKNIHHHSDTSTKGKKGKQKNEVGNKRGLEEEGVSPSKNKRQKLHLPKPLDGGSRGTLFQKLVEEQISEDEKLLLQCIRFICDSNFFFRGEEEKESSAGSSDFKELMTVYESSSSPSSCSPKEEDNASLISS